MNAGSGNNFWLSRVVPTENPQKAVAMRKHLSSWDDMSNYVVHFTKDGDGEDDYGNIMGIYSRRCLIPRNPFGIARGKAPNGAPQEAVCFSEVPPGLWDRLVKRRGTKLGIAFTKEFIVSKGGGPVWYAWKDTPHWQTVRAMMDMAKGDPTAPIWKLTPMIDAPGEYDNRDYQFDWEREWRHVGTLGFEVEDVAFLMIPEDTHSAAWGFFKDAEADDTGPAFYCPYVDPTWNKAQILSAINNPEKCAYRQDENYF